MRKRAEKLDQQRSRFNEETELVCSGRFLFLFLEQRRGRLVTGSPWSIRYGITSVPQIAIWNLSRPPSTFVSPDPTSRNVRGSVTTTPPQLMIKKPTNEPLSRCFLDSRVYRPAGRLSDTNQRRGALKSTAGVYLMLNSQPLRKKGVLSPHCF